MLSTYLLVLSMGKVSMHMWQSPTIDKRKQHFSSNVFCIGCLLYMCNSAATQRNL